MYRSDRTAGVEEATRTGREDGDRVGNELEEKQMAEEPFSEAYLRRVAGEEDLGGVRNLVLTVDTNETQVDHLGALMPLLSELRLERGSTLASFRDLGSSLANLRVVWFPACGIRHLDGVGALSSLEELYLAFNDVEDLTSIALHDRLEVLDLESNSVRDAEQAIQLGTCSRLWSLTLTANPVCRDRHYRRVIVEAVPQLASLDEEDITDDDRRPLSAAHEGEDSQLPFDTHQTLPKYFPSPHHHRSPGTNPVKQPPLEGAKQPYPEQFPLGSAGTGNRNLREMETSDTYRSRQNSSRGGVVPPLSSGGVGPGEGGEQGAAAAAFQVSEMQSPNSSGRRSQPLDKLHGDSGEGPPGETPAAAEPLDSFSERWQGWKHTGESVRAGGVEEEEDEAVSHENRGVDRRRGAEGRWGAGRRRDVTSPSDTAQQAFVDEEEMVVRAIKNFRLLSNADTANEGNGRSPRWRVAAERKTTPYSRSSHTATNECGATWTAEEDAVGTGGTKGDEDRSPASQREGVLKSENGTTQSSVGHAHGRAEAGQSHSARGRITPGEDNFCEGSDWLLKVLSLEDMGPVTTPRGTGAAGEGINDAASALTHGSQMSIAGNPAFGLRRRRVLDQSVKNTRSGADASTSSLAPHKAEPHHQETPSARAGVDIMGGGREGEPSEESRLHPLTTTESSKRVRQKSADEEARRCEGVSGTPPNGDLENKPSTAGGRTTTGGGPDAESAPMVSAPALSWPHCRSSHDARSVRRCGTLGHERQSDFMPVDYRCCRALLSPPTRSPQSLRCVRRRPAVAERGPAATGAESFVDTLEASKAGTCLSPPSGVAVGVSRGVEVVADVYSRTRNSSRAGSTETRKSWGVLNSSSAASLRAPNRAETVVVGHEGGQEKIPTTPGRRGTSGTSSCSAIGTERPGGDSSADSDCRNSCRDGEGIGRLDDGLSSRSHHRKGSKTSRGLKPSEVPEWSPTATFENDSGIRDRDFGFRFCGAREQAENGGSLDRDGGGGMGQPFAPMEVVREEGGGTAVGEGVSESDEALVALLRERPKNVPQIRTRGSFRNYFRGMDRGRLGRLLREAYADRGSVECDAKVKKRLMLLERSLGASFR